MYDFFFLFFLISGTVLFGLAHGLMLSFWSWSSVASFAWFLIGRSKSGAEYLLLLPLGMPLDPTSHIWNVNFDQSFFITGCSMCVSDQLTKGYRPNLQVIAEQQVIVLFRIPCWSSLPMERHLCSHHLHCARLQVGWWGWGDTSPWILLEAQLLVMWWAVHLGARLQLASLVAKISRH